MRVNIPSSSESTAERRHVRTTTSDPVDPVIADEPRRHAGTPVNSAVDEDAALDVPAAHERTLLETALDAIRRHLEELYRALGLFEAEE